MAAHAHSALEAGHILGPLGAYPAHLWLMSFWLFGAAWGRLPVPAAEAVDSQEQDGSGLEEDDSEKKEEPRLVFQKCQR